MKIEHAFPRRLADEGRAILWRDTGCDPNDRRPWTKPVIRLAQYGQQPFVQAANTPVLHNAFDQLVGPGRWLPRTSLGTFPVRFPSPEDPGDAGWHIDPSFGTENPDFLSWRANVSSRGRALLMLFLFSDVGDEDAPTRIRVGSHVDIARMLAPAGEAGLSLCELAAKRLCGNGVPARSSSDRRCGYRVPVSSIPGARGAAAPRSSPAVHGATTAAAHGGVPAHRGPA